MNKKKFANFNLNQSLKDFQVNITELLQLNNVAQWNGITIKEREKKIREAALILAGQCIGVLLNNLSKSFLSSLYSNPFYKRMVEKKDKKEWIKKLANSNNRECNN